MIKVLRVDRTGFKVLRNDLNLKEKTGLCEIGERRVSMTIEYLYNVF